MKRLFLDAIYLTALCLLSPWLIWRSLKTGRYREGLKQKFLGLTHDEIYGAGKGPTVWLHGVSVGEVQLLIPLIEAIRRELPEVQCVLSTTTESGMELARKRIVDVPLFYFPWDFSWSVRRTLRVLSPTLLVTGELELWPNLIDAAQVQGTAILVANGRLSERSFRGYQRAGILARSMFSKLTAVAAQSETDAGRFIDCGCPRERVIVSGNVKFDNVQSDRRHGEVQRLRQLVGVGDEHRIVVVGSTQEPEERAALQSFQRLLRTCPELRLIVVPRHPDRFETVYRELQDELGPGVRLTRRSEIEGAPIHAQDWQVLMVDTVGELRWWWGLAEIAIVGGSFGSRGGQNMLEPAAYGANVGFGPNTSNFRDIVSLLLQEQAAEVIPSLEHLPSWLESQVHQPSQGKHRGKRARELVLRQQGAMRRTLDEVKSLLVEHGVGSINARKSKAA